MDSTTPDKSIASDHATHHANAQQHKAHPKKKPSRAGLWSSLAAVALAAAAYSWIATQNEWEEQPRPYPYSSPAAPAISSSKPSITQVPSASQEELRQLRAELEASIERAAAQVNKLEERLTMLESQPTATTNNSAETSPPAEATDIQPIAELQQKIAALEARMASLSQTSRTQIESLHVLDALAERLEQGAPYADLLQEWKQLQPQDASTAAALAPHAASGAPTLPALAHHFHETVVLALPASLASKKNADSSDAVRMRLGSILTIRKTDVPANDTSDEAILARAEKALEAGDIAATLAQVKLLSNDPRLLFAPWQQQAEQYLSLRAVIKQARLRTLAPQDIN